MRVSKFAKLALAVSLLAAVPSVNAEARYEQPAEPMVKDMKDKASARQRVQKDLRVTAHQRNAGQLMLFYVATSR